MNTLEERLKKSGYAEQLKEQERDKKLVETARRDFELSGREPSAEFLKFEEAVKNCDASLAAMYESTVKLVDSRNDLELELMQILETMELAAEEWEATDPEKAARIRSLLAEWGWGDDKDRGEHST